MAGIVAVADKAGAVREKLRDRGFRDRGVQALDKLPDGIVELELALFAQLQDAGRGEALRMRGDAKAMARREFFAARKVAWPKARSRTILSRCAMAMMQPGCCDVRIWNSIEQRM